MNCKTKALVLFITFLNASFNDGRTDLHDDTLLSIIDQIEESIEKVGSEDVTEVETETSSEVMIQSKQISVQARVPQRLQFNCGR